MGRRRSDPGLLDVPIGVGCFVVGMGALLLPALGSLFSGDMGTAGQYLFPILLLGVPVALLIWYVFKVEPAKGRSVAQQFHQQHDPLYTEGLPFGGKLVITGTDWHLLYYFPGPDLRYNGTYFKIDGPRLGAYYEAYLANFEQFEQLKQTTPRGSEVTFSADCGMTIRIGRFREGVCVQSCEMPISTRADLKTLLESFQYASRRAAEMTGELRRKR